MLPQEFEISEYGHEKVIEVVGHTAGQLANHLHLLRLQQLPLFTFPLLNLTQDSGVRCSNSSVLALIRSSSVSLSCLI